MAFPDTGNDTISLVSSVPEILETIGRDLEFDRAVTALSQERATGLVIRGAVASGASAFAVSVAEQVGATRVVHADPATAQVPFAALLQLLGTERGAVAALADVATAADAVVAAASIDRSPIVVDDAQYLDDASAMSLALAAATGVPLVLVLDETASVPTPLAATVAPMPEVRLHDLDDAEIAQLAAVVLGSPIEPVLVRSLTRLVGGAAAAIIDVLESSVAEGTVESVRDVWRQRSQLELPDVTLRRVDAHLSSLTESQGDALDLVSLVPALPLAVADRLVAADDLIALERAGLVDVSDSISGELVSVRLPVVRSARHQQAGRLRRRRLAQGIHEVLREISSPVDPHLVTTVLLESGGAPEGAAALAAARQARLDGEVELALRLCRSGPFDAVGVDLAILQAEVLASVGQSEAADEVLQAITTTNDEQFALVVMTRAVNLAFHRDRVDDARQLLDEATRQLTAGPWAAETIGLRGVLDLMMDQPLDAIARVEQYLEPAAGREFVEAATAAGPSLIMVGRHDEAAALSRSAMHERLRLGEQTSLSSAGLHALVCGMALAEAGHFAEAAEFTEFVLGAAVDIRDFDGMIWAGVIRGRAQLDEGHLDAAIASFELAASAALDLDLGLQLRWARAGVVLAVAQCGDPRATRRALDALDSCPPTHLALMRSEIARARGWGAIALRELRQGVEHFRSAAAIAREHGEAGLEILALHDLVRIGETADVERLIEVGEMVDGELAATRVAHGRALCAGDPGGLGEASERFEEIGAIVLAAEVANQASWIERRRQHAAAAERLRVRALELRSRRPLARTPALAAHPGLARLTLREREVAGLASAGHPSKEIAGRLGVSTRTVDNLLQRVYRKLDVGGRSGLQAVLLDDPHAPSW